MPVVIQTVKFRSTLSEEEARRVMEERAPQFRALPGLLQKYYVWEPATGEISGIYIWDSEESLRAFRASELALSCASPWHTLCSLCSQSKGA